MPPAALNGATPQSVNAYIKSVCDIMRRAKRNGERRAGLKAWGLEPRWRLKAPGYIRTSVLGWYRLRAA